MNPEAIKQGSEAWHKQRLGKITGSRFKDVLSTRGNTRINYMRELLLERKTGIVAESYTNDAMAWGIATEPQARKYFEEITSFTVKEVGFIQHPQELYHDWVGVSPDGLIANSSGIEIKCPDTKTHLDYIAKNKLPSAYIAQVQGCMWVTGRKHWYFVSFDPRVEKEPFWCILVKRDENYIKKLATACDEFIQELIEMEKTSTTGIDPAILLDKTAPSIEEWEQRKKEIDEGLQKIVEGKVRHGVVCAMIQDGALRDGLTDELKKLINEWVEFICTGE